MHHRIKGLCLSLIFLGCNNEQDSTDGRSNANSVQNEDGSYSIVGIFRKKSANSNPNSNPNSNSIATTVIKTNTEAGVKSAIGTISDPTETSAQAIVKTPSRYTDYELNFVTRKRLGPVQDQKLADFKAAGAQFKPSKFKALPSGIAPKYKPGLQAIFNLMNDRMLVFRQMQELEVDVQIRADRKGISSEQALYEVLAEWEQKGGFKPAIDLKPETYSREQWLEMLKEGALFNDKQFKDQDRKGTPHAELTHRLQWHAIIRYLLTNPRGLITNGLTPADYYIKMGSPDPESDWKGTGVEDQDKGNQHLFFNLFDSFDKNFTSPEFFRSLHGYWPSLGNWSFNRKVNLGTENFYASCQNDEKTMPG